MSRVNTNSIIQQNYVTPRISANNLSKFAGKTVCLTLEVLTLAEHGFTAKCLGSEMTVNVINIPSSNSFTQMMEVYVDVSPKGELRYVGHCQLDDDVDKTLIRKTLDVIQANHSALFW